MTSPHRHPSPRPLRRHPDLRSGFTLVELLVVVSVIGVLATLSIGAVTRAKQRSRSAGCMSNLRQIGTLVHLFAADHNNEFPNLRGKDNYVHALSEYIPRSNSAATNNVFVSPAAVHRPTNAGDNFTYALHNTLFADYGIRLNNVARPSELIMAGNGAQIQGYGYACAFTFWETWQMHHGNSQWVQNMDEFIAAPDYTNVDDNPGQGWLRYVHNGNTAVNALMVDGHVETFTRGTVRVRHIVYDR